jgi:hypothetical protein
VLDLVPTVYRAQLQSSREAPAIHHTGKGSGHLKLPQA